MQQGLRTLGEARRAAEDSDAVAHLAVADSLFRLAAESDREWPAPALQRGWVSLERARNARGPEAGTLYQSAIARADSVLSRDPQNARALELRGTARFQYYSANIDIGAGWRRLLEGAREDLEKSVGIQSNASAWLTLSVLYYHFDDVPSALLAAQRAYEADSYLERAEEVINRIFFGYLDRGDFGVAQRWCLLGASRFPRDPQFLTCQLFLQVTPNITLDVPQAWRLVARLDSLQTDSSAGAMAGVLTGGVLARAGLADSARNVWSRTRAKFPSVANAGQILALEAYARTLTGDADDMNEAIDLLKRAVAANPDHDFANTAGQYWWWNKLRAHPRWREIQGR
jgi:tetratricopeptide (TPR) repeat protein